MSIESNRTSNKIAGSSFEAFLEGWLVRQEHHLDELLSTLQTCHESRDDDLRDLIARVLAHYQEYYQEKSRVANRNVFLVFSAPWFTPFERAFLWIAGFKPGLAFRLVTNSVNDLTEDQSQRMSQLKDETKVREKELTEELARIQESVAAPPMLELARLARGGGPVDGEVLEVDSVLETLGSSLASVLANADLLRTRTAERVVDILSPVQSLKFLVAVARLQLRIRMWGLQKKAVRRATTDGW